MKNPVYPTSAQQQQTQFVCWGFSVLRHIILKNADSRSVLIQLYLFMNKTILDHRIDCTVHVVQDTHGTQDSLHVLYNYRGWKLIVIKWKQTDGLFCVDVVSSLFKAQFEIRTRTQFDQFTVFFFFLSPSCYGNTREQENAFWFIKKSTVYSGFQPD